MDTKYSLTDPNIVYIVGYGNLPSNCALRDFHSEIVLSLLVDTNTDIVVDATVNTINEMSVRFISAQIVGRNLLTEQDKIVEGLTRYQTPAQKSLTVALKATVDRYRNYLRTIGISRP